MNDTQNIQHTFHDGVFTITLSREHKRNAINEQTMDELLHAIQSIPVDGSVKLAILRATGKDFCAGADLDWMRNTQQMSQEQLQLQNMKLQRVFQFWFDLPLFTLAFIHGNVVGGAIGLVAASDLVIARPDTRFRFSEVTLGLIPATIAPFVLQRSSRNFVRQAMLTAQPFDVQKALENGLVDIVAGREQEQNIVAEYSQAMNKTESMAVGKTKKLVNDLKGNRIDEPLDVYTTRLLAQVRKSDVVAQRISAFFNSTEK